MADLSDKEWAERLREMLQQDSVRGVDFGDARWKHRANHPLNLDGVAAQSMDETTDPDFKDFGRRFDNNVNKRRRAQRRDISIEPFYGRLDDTVTGRAPEPDRRRVDVTVGAPQITFRNGAYTTADGKQTLARPAESPQADQFDVQPGEPAIYAVDGVQQSDKQLAERLQTHEAKRPRGHELAAKILEQDPRRDVQGGVQLANQDKNGKKSLSDQQLKRSSFGSDEEFDKAVEVLRKQNLVWDPETDGKSEKSGGGFLNSVKKGLSSLVGGATPSGAGGGTQDDGTGRRGGDVGSAVPNPAGKAFEAPVEESYKNAGGPGTFPNSAAMGAGGPNAPAGSMGGQGGGSGQNVSPGTSGGTPIPAGGDPTMPMLNGGNNVLSVPGYAAGSLVGGDSPSVDPSAPGAPTPELPPVQGGGAGIGASFRGGAAERRIEAPADQPSQDPALKAAADMQIQALGHAAEISGARDRAISKVQEDTANQQSLDQAFAQRKLEFVQQGQKDMMKNIADAQAVLNNPAKTPDPERYWKSHSKIMFAIGVGLLAQAGKDINGVLSNVNQAIDRDVEEQKAEFEAPRNAARSKQAQAQSMYGMFRDMGHDAFEAQKMAAAVLKDRTSTEIAKIAAASDSESVQFNAQQAQGLVMQKGAEDAQAASQHRAANDEARFGHQITQEHDIAETSRENAALRLKADEMSAGKGAISDADTRKLADSVSGLDELTRAGKVFGSGLGSSVYNKLAGLDPTAQSTAAAFNANRPMYTRILMSLTNPTERQNEMMMRNVGQMVPSAGDLNGKVRWDAVLKFIGERVGGEADALRSKGRGAKVDQITAPLRQGGGGTHEETTKDGRKILVRD